jgi:hypothetical protein
VSSSPVPVEVWAMDEHRLGLKPIVRRVWVPRRTAPTVKVYPRYTWLYLYGFVQPETGKTFWLLLPTVNIAMMNLALREFASAVGAGASKRVVLVLDGAGWHTSAAVVIPEGIELMRCKALMQDTASGGTGGVGRIGVRAASTTGSTTPAFNTN